MLRWPSIPTPRLLVRPARYGAAMRCVRCRREVTDRLLWDRTPRRCDACGEWLPGSPEFVVCPWGGLGTGECLCGRCGTDDPTRPLVRPRDADDCTVPKREPSAPPGPEAAT